MYLLYCLSVVVAEDQPTVGDEGGPGGSVKGSDTAAVAVEPPTAVASAGSVTTPQDVTTVGSLTTFQ